MKQTEKKTLLVVDDDMSVLESIDFVLTGMGYNILLAPDGQSAINVLKTHWIDGIILDLRMPKASGFYVASMIKAESLNDEAKILVLSGESLMISQVSVKIPNLIGKITKPFNLPQLKKAVTLLV